jgi:hypothetical protein
MIAVKAKDDTRPPLLECMVMEIGEQLPAELDKMYVIDNVPFEYICPQKIEFLPHEFNSFVIHSICDEGAGNGVINKLFHFNLLVEKVDKDYLVGVTMNKIHDLTSFTSPYFCTTDSYIHVFEREKIAFNGNNYVAFSTEKTSRL